MSLKCPFCFQPPLTPAEERLFRTMETLSVEFGTEGKLLIWQSDLAKAVEFGTTGYLRDVLGGLQRKGFIDWQKQPAGKRLPTEFTLLRKLAEFSWVVKPNQTVQHVEPDYDRDI